jgi:hypothetical protein
VGDGSRRASAAAGCVAALLLAACSSDDEETPAACLAGGREYVEALGAAPGEARLDEDTAISECLPPEQQGGELAQVGEAIIAAATELNRGARRDPTGPETVRLGYLVGAVERGADPIHADLVRRLSAAARFSPSGLLPASFERTFGRGYSAGLDSG